MSPTGTSFRFVRACARSGGKTRVDRKSYADSLFSLFPSAARDFLSLSPCEITCSLFPGINEINGDQLSPSGIK